MRSSTVLHGFWPLNDLQSGGVVHYPIRQTPSPLLLFEVIGSVFVISESEIGDRRVFPNANQQGLQNETDRLLEKLQFLELHRAMGITATLSFKVCNTVPHEKKNMWTVVTLIRRTCQEDILKQVCGRWNQPTKDENLCCV